MLSNSENLTVLPWLIFNCASVVNVANFAVKLEFLTKLEILDIPGSIFFLSWHMSW